MSRESQRGRVFCNHIQQGFRLGDGPPLVNYNDGWRFRGETADPDGAVSVGQMGSTDSGVCGASVRLTPRFFGG